MKKKEKREKIRRNQIWLVVDKNKALKEGKSDKNNHVQAFAPNGTRYCIVVQNNTGNCHSPVIEVVYCTKSESKSNIPTHFITDSTPKRSVVLCEQIDSLPKRDFKKCYGTLTEEEVACLDKCLKISLGLK